MIGVDEVGRGCWAGPLLVVAARAVDDLPIGLKDSKLLLRTQREEFFIKLQKSCKFGEGWVSVEEIDEHGLAGALRLGVSRALSSLGTKVDEEIILDGKVNYIPEKFRKGRAVVDGDNSVQVVSAASVYAKVVRDKFMYNLAADHPAYGFEKHVGYGTALHKLALESHGVLNKIHRMSFKPVKLLSGQIG